MLHSAHALHTWHAQQQMMTYTEAATMTPALLQLLL
jgi:hypothetical protein